MITHVSDSVTAQEFEFDTGNVRYGPERLLLEPLEDSLYRLACIPALCGELAIGDVVRLHNDGADYEVVEASGHKTLAMEFSPPFEDREIVSERLQGLGFRTENIASCALVADLPNIAAFTVAWGVIGPFQRGQRLTYAIINEDNHPEESEVEPYEEGLVRHLHYHPLWSDRGDRLAGIRPPEPDDEELLWVGPVGEMEFEVCCVPALAYDISIGDIVRVDERMMVQEVVRRGGHSTFRAIIQNKRRESFMYKQLEKLGVGVEPYSCNVWALDAPTEEIADRLTEYLATEKALGSLEWEFGGPK